MVTKKRENATKRKRGEGEKRGVTKEEILRYALAHGGSFEEPALRDYLAEKLNIGQRGGKVIKEHLQDLKERGLLKKTTISGYANVWSINSIEGIGNICNMFSGLIHELPQHEFILDIVVDSIYPLGHDGFKNALKNSTTFLKLFVLPPQDRNERIAHLCEIELNIKPRVNKRTLPSLLSSHQGFLLELCLASEIINGEINEKGLKILTKLYRNREEVMTYNASILAWEAIERNIEKDLEEKKITKEEGIRRKEQIEVLNEEARKLLLFYAKK